MWQEPPAQQTPVTTSSRRGSSWWRWREQQKKEQGKWTCPVVRPRLYFKDAEGAATRWTLTLRSATSPIIQSAVNTASSPSRNVITVVVSPALGPRKLLVLFLIGGGAELGGGGTVLLRGNAGWGG